MPLRPKSEVIADYRQHEKDTGSPEVQVAVVSERSKTRTEHRQTREKDSHPRRGLLVMVGQRRRLLDYVKRVDNGRYDSLINRLGLRR